MNTRLILRAGYTWLRHIAVGTGIIGLFSELLLLPAHAAQPRGMDDGRIHDIRNLARRFEVPLMAKKPVWAQPKSKCLFSFAWISDIHLNQHGIKRLIRGLHFIDHQLKPNFVLITGDNSAIIPPATATTSGQSKNLRRQLFFRELLQKNLRTPTVVIPGDNWPGAFEQVFGSFHFSFNYGGVHFLCTGLDQVAPGEGCGIFNPKTWKWMRADLAANKDRPTLFIMHESILPPAFLEAGKVRKMLESSPNVIGCLNGHIHLDLEFHSQQVGYLVCPAFGPHPAHAIKRVSVYRHALILTTYRQKNDTWVQEKKWQRLDIPLRLRSALDGPAPGPFKRENEQHLPPTPRILNKKLAKRSGELLAPAFQFLYEFKDTLENPH